MGSSDHAIRPQPRFFLDWIEGLKKLFIFNAIMWNIFWSGLLALIIASVIKSIRAKSKRAFFSVGGMPSSHSALVSAVCFSVWFNESFSNLFFVSFALAVIVMHDAIKVRMHHSRKELFYGVLTGIICAVVVFYFKV